MSDREALEQIAAFSCEAATWANEEPPQRDRCLDSDYVEGMVDGRCHPCRAFAALANAGWAEAVIDSWSPDERSRAVEARARELAGPNHRHGAIPARFWCEAIAALALAQVPAQESLPWAIEYVIERLADTDLFPNWQQPGNVIGDLVDVLHGGLTGKPPGLSAIGARCPVCDAKRGLYDVPPEPHHD